MQSPPDWPPTPGALRPSPFPHPALHALHGLARALLFPAYWALDQLLGCWAPAAHGSGPRWLSTAAVAGAALLLLLLSLPLALTGLLLWLPLQIWRRPFCYQPPPQCWAPPVPWRPPDEPARCFGFLSANLCLLPDGLASFSNLQHSQRRAEAVGAALHAGLRPSRYGATGCSPPRPGGPCGMLTDTVPTGLDFVCLQEMFDLRSERRLVSRLAPNMGPVLYDVGTFGLQPGPHLKLLGSGLLLASRYPLLRVSFRSFPHAGREESLASKGLLSAQDGPLRCKQLSLLLDWAEQFEAESRQNDEDVAFSVLLADAQEQRHPLFNRFRDPCRLGTRWEQPWALGTAPGGGGPREGSWLRLPLTPPSPPPTGTLLSTSTLRHSVACSPEMLRRALEQEEGRHRYLAGPPGGGRRAKPWQGRRLDYITYRGAPGSPLSPVSARAQSAGFTGPGAIRQPGSRPQEVEQVTFSTALAGLTDHLAVGLRLRVSMPQGGDRCEAGWTDRPGLQSCEPDCSP
ncbi:hypothetical protein MC885_008658 [Smutsia gigantea]|nr:hypothetical protein MC885_008658 [Smutsia gigantea]